MRPIIRQLLKAPLGRILFILVLALGAVASASAQAFALNVTSTPITGVPITVVPPDDNGLSNGNTNFTRTYTDNFSPVVVNLTAPNNFRGETFFQWSINGITQSPGQLTISVVMNQVQNCVAIYNTPNYLVSVDSTNPNTGVTINAAPPDVANNSSGVTSFQLNYPNLTNVTLTAPIFSGGNAFDHWLVGGVAQPQGQLALNFTVNGVNRVNAVYVAPIPINVQALPPNTMVAVTASPPDAKGLTGGTTNFILNYAPTQVVTLTAPPTSGANVFTNWTINGVAQPAGQMSIMITVSAATTVVAVYGPPLTVNASAIGTHGTIKPSGTVLLPPGASQTFTATPAAGYVISQWTLDGAVAQAGGATFQINRIAANHTLTVSFVVTIVFHPADTNKDARMTIGEITAYGAAWKHGTAWPNAPSPIPASFITNAIMLWKSGELYTYDPNRAVPDAWIPISMAPQIAKPAVTAQQNLGTSIASITLLPDGWWQVNITVTPPTGTRAFTLEEHLPRGAQVAALSSGGVFDQRGLTLRWGPFMDSSVRIFTYRIKLSAGRATSGSASFDGKDVATKGDRSLGGK